MRPDNGMLMLIGKHGDVHTREYVQPIRPNGADWPYVFVLNQEINGLRRASPPAGWGWRGWVHSAGPSQVDKGEDTCSAEVICLFFSSRLFVYLFSSPMCVFRID